MHINSLRAAGYMQIRMRTSPDELKKLRFRKKKSNNLYPSETRRKVWVQTVKGYH